MKHTSTTILSILCVSSLVFAAACGSDADQATEQDTQAASSYAAGRFELNLDGKRAGVVHAVEGGGASTSGAFENFAVQIGFDMTPAVYDWIENSWKSNYARKDGSIIAADFNLDAKSEREFFHALVTEFGIPACDGSAKDPAYITLKFSPEYVRYKAAVGRVKEAAKFDEKVWLPSNFRFELGDMNTKSISKIDAITVKQTVMAHEIGDAGVSSKSASPDVSIHLPESESAAWSKWLDGARNGAPKKTGSLVFLASNRETELGRITFSGVSIFSVEPEKSEANADNVKLITVRLHTAGVSLRVPSR